MGLIVVISVTILLFFALLGKYLLKDLVLYFLKFSKAQFRLFLEKGNNIGQLLATFVLSGFIGFLSYMLFRGLLILVAYLLGDNLIEFFIINRGVFSTHGTELQNPYIFKNLFYGAFIIPVTQLLAIAFLIKGMKYFMFKVNSFFKQKIYSVSSLVFFGTFASLVFLAIELSAFSQSIKLVSTTTLMVLLIGAKLSYLLFYFGLIHVELLQNTNYTNAFNELRLNYVESKIITNKTLLLCTMLVIAIVLNYPLYSGFQFGDNNWVILLKLLFVGALFFLLFKYVFAKGFNYIGVYMIDANKNQDILPLQFIHKKTKKIISYITIAFISALLFFSFKNFVFLSLNALLICALSFGILLFFYVVGSLYAYFFQHTTQQPFLHWKIISHKFRSFLMLLLPSLCLMLMSFSVITFFPKKIDNLEKFTNYQKSIIDDDGNLLFFEQKDDNPSIAISHKNLPPFFVKALLIKEDRKLGQQNQFLPNRTNWHGVSLTTLYSAFLVGSSNLNQQLIKNLAFEKFPQEIQRKFTEVAASYQLSKDSSPEQIINHYINVVSFNGGSGHSGILKASYHTFGKSITQINELEMLYLLFTLHRGNNFKLNKDTYIPYNETYLHADQVKEKLLVYAKNWYKDDLITKKEFSKIKKQELNFRKPFQNKVVESEKMASVNQKLAPYVCNNAAALNTFFLKELKKNEEAGTTFESSISLAKQSKVQTAVKKFHKKFASFQTKKGNQLHAASLVVDVQTGKILAHYGGETNVDLTNFGNGSFSASCFKPIVLLELLEQGHEIELFDGAIKGRKTPKNHNKAFSNTYVSEVEILKYSKNAPMRNIDQLTNPIPLFKNIEKKFNLMNIPNDPSIQLYDKGLNLENTFNYPIGSRRMTLCSLAQMYQMIFNEGKYIQLNAFNTSFNPYTLSEKEIEKSSIQMYNEEHVYTITNALKRTMEHGGTGYALSKYLPKNIQFMCKTGTTNNYKDGLTVLSDGKILVISYVSYGKEDKGKLTLGKAEIPYKSGGRSAGVLSAMIFKELYKV